MAYADQHVRKDGSFLGLLDLGLLVSHKHPQASVRFVYYDVDPEFRVQSLAQIVGQHWPDCPVKLFQETETTELWTFVAVHALYQKVHHDVINHWVPAWTRHELGPDGFELQKRMTEGRLAEERLEILEQLSESDLGLFGDSLMEAQEKLDDEDAFFAEMHQRNLIVQRVAADGNCGLWTYAALRNRVPRPDDSEHPVPKQVISHLRNDSCIAVKCCFLMLSTQ